MNVSVVVAGHFSPMVVLKLVCLVTVLHTVATTVVTASETSVSSSVGHFAIVKL